MLDTYHYWTRGASTKIYVVALGGPADAERQRDLDEYILERRKGMPNGMSVISMTKRDPEAALLFTQKAARLHEAHPDILGHLILRDLGSMIDKASRTPPESTKYRAHAIRLLCSAASPR